MAETANFGFGSVGRGWCVAAGVALGLGLAGVASAFGSVVAGAPSVEAGSATLELAGLPAAGQLAGLAVLGAAWFAGVRRG